MGSLINPDRVVVILSVYDFSVVLAMVPSGSSVQLNPSHGPVRKRRAKVSASLSR